MQTITGLVCGCAAPIADQPQKQTNKKKNTVWPDRAIILTQTQIRNRHLLHRNTGAESSEKSVQR